MGTSLVSRYYAQSHSNNALLASLSKDSDVLMWHSIKARGSLFQDAAKSSPVISSGVPVGFSEDQSKYKVDLFGSGDSRPMFVSRNDPFLAFFGSCRLITGADEPTMNGIAVIGDLAGKNIVLSDAKELLSLGNADRLVVGENFFGSLFELLIFNKSMSDKKKKRILSYLAARHGLSKRSI